jgi:hypothetical protein
MSRFTPSLPEYDAAMHEGISLVLIAELLGDAFV